MTNHTYVSLEPRGVSSPVSVTYTSLVAFRLVQIHPSQHSNSCFAASVRPTTADLRVGLERRKSKQKKQAECVASVAVCYSVAAASIKRSAHSVSLLSVFFLLLSLPLLSLLVRSFSGRRRRRKGTSIVACPLQSVEKSLIGDGGITCENDRVHRLVELEFAFEFPLGDGVPMFIPFVHL